MSSVTDILAHDRRALERLSDKTFLITGANGMLGRAFKAQIERHVPTGRVFGFDKSQLDVRLPEEFAKLDHLQIDYILHCAALVDADYCEERPDEGRQSIVEGTRNAAVFANERGAKMLYPQSFLIYDGKDSIIDETSVPRPLGVYGKLKLEAEEIVLAADARALCVRMGGFFGGESADNNFVGRITPHLAQLVKRGQTSIEIGNRVWQPSYTNDLAANCLLLLAADCTGTYCMASHESASFHELTVEIARQTGSLDKIRIGCVDAVVLAAKEKAKRPNSAVMHNARLQAEGLDRQRTWRESLSEYLHQPYFMELFK